MCKCWASRAAHVKSVLGKCDRSPKQRHERTDVYTCVGVYVWHGVAAYVSCVRLCWLCVCVSQQLVASSAGYYAPGPAPVLAGAGSATAHLMPQPHLSYMANPSQSLVSSQLKISPHPAASIDLFKVFHQRFQSAGGWTKAVMWACICLCKIWLSNRMHLVHRHAHLNPCF